MKRIDLEGRRFGHQTVLGKAKRQRGGSAWVVRCDCGTVRDVRTDSLTTNGSTSCGCSRTRNLDVYDRTVEYKTWCAMRHRVRNGKVSLCERWEIYDNFLSDMGRRPSDLHSIDRIDNNGIYSPDNCRWAQPVVQARNRSSNRIISYLGESRCLAEWAEIYAISKRTVWDRLSAGWSMDKALTEPPIPSRQRGVLKGSLPAEYASEYSSWKKMKQRCGNPRNDSYKYYGGRGISVCESWMVFHVFLNDMGAKENPDLTIDRIDVDLGYCKENCRWADRKQQVRNRRNSRQTGPPIVPFPVNGLSDDTETS